jgi:Protein of unknown function (DUF3043)
VHVFGRGTKDAAGVTNPADPLGAGSSAPATKGKATPKRSDAQAARKTAAIGQSSVRGGRTASGGGTSARSGRSGRLTQQQARARRDAMRRGDESSLTARDRGPARRFARDFVDSRRNVIGLFVPVAVPVIILGYSKASHLQIAANIVLYTFVLGSVIDCVRTSRAIRNQVATRFPNESTKGLGLYAAMRAMQFRRMRVPGPRVARGAKV